MLTYQEMALRLVLATILGSLVGLERQRLDWAAGLRTHMMVCVGSALAMIVSAYGFHQVIDPGRIVLDPSRIAAQVVSGIGFLGAGTILFLRHEVVRGLTTAAGLWTVACVGLAVGSGLYIAAIIATVLALIILALIKPLESMLFSAKRPRVITVIIDRKQTSLASIEEALEQEQLVLTQIIIQRGEAPDEDYIKLMLSYATPKERLPALMDRLRNISGIREISFQNDRTMREN